MNRIGSFGNPDDGRRASGVGRARLAMSAEIVLRRVAFACAIFLLFGMFSDRTSEVDGHTTGTDAAGYHLVATFSGIVVIAALAASDWARPRVVLPVLGAAVVIAAFGLTVFVSGIYCLALVRGELLFLRWRRVPETRSLGRGPSRQGTAFLCRRRPDWRSSDPRARRHLATRSQTRLVRRAEFVSSRGPRNLQVVVYPRTYARKRDTSLRLGMTPFPHGSLGTHPSNDR